MERDQTFYLKLVIRILIVLIIVKLMAMYLI